MREICFYSSIIISLLVVSCNPRPVENQQQIIDEIESREIRRVTKAAIAEEALRQGDLISSISQQTLSKALAQAIQEGGIQKGIEKCNIKAYPLLDSLSDIYGAEISRVSLKQRNPLNLPDSIEKEILEAYEYAHQKALELAPNIEEISENVILYTKPILIKNTLCLNCHGKVDQDLIPEHYNIIHALYPADSAIGYSIEDLRGMWSIRFMKRNLVNSVN